MPSFDVVSEIDFHELSNAVDQANREIDNRFDFKGLNAKFTSKENVVTLQAPSDFQVKQMYEILQNKLAKRSIDVACLSAGDIESNLSEARQEVTIRHGIDKDFAKKIIKTIKETKIKVQTAIQGEQVRVTGKKRDDLQEVMSALREAPLEIPLQYVNFRD